MERNIIRAQIVNYSGRYRRVDGYILIAEETNDREQSIGWRLCAFAEHVYKPRRKQNSLGIPSSRRDSRGDTWTRRRTAGRSDIAAIGRLPGVMHRHRRSVKISIKQIYPITYPHRANRPLPRAVRGFSGWTRALKFPSLGFT